jgi:hypothetical protein
MFENKMLRMVYGPTRQKVTGGWRKLHNEELHSLYFSPNIKANKSKMMRWVGM